MKLVRDFIPQIIESGGRKCEYRKVRNLDEHMRQLRAKMNEETNEFFDDPCVEEAADMLEVLFAFTFLHNIEFEDVLEAARVKQEERGGFMEGLTYTWDQNESVWETEAGKRVPRTCLVTVQFRVQHREPPHADWAATGNSEFLGITNTAKSLDLSE